MKENKIIIFKPTINIPLKPIYPNKKVYKKYLKKVTKYWYYFD